MFCQKPIFLLFNNFLVPCLARTAEALAKKVSRTLRKMGLYGENNFFLKSRPMKKGNPKSFYSNKTKWYAVDTTSKRAVSRRKCGMAAKRRYRKKTNSEGTRRQGLTEPKWKPSINTLVWVAGEIIMIEKICEHFIKNYSAETITDLWSSLKPA